MSAQASAKQALVIPAAAKVRAVAITKLFSALSSGAGPWVMYENGTVVLLRRTLSAEKDRNALIKEAAEHCKLRKSTTYQAEPVVAIWGDPIPEGVIVISKSAMLDKMPVLDVMPTGGPIDQEAHGREALARREKDLEEQKAVLTSVDQL